LKELTQNLVEEAQKKQEEAQKKQEEAQQREKTKAIRLAMRMLKDGETITCIMEETELTETEILELKNEIAV
jgi:hypothetical protein